MTLCYAQKIVHLPWEEGFGPSTRGEELCIIGLLFFDQGVVSMFTSPSKRSISHDNTKVLVSKAIRKKR